MMRDYRINLIFEGSSEIMHLFLARSGRLSRAAGRRPDESEGIDRRKTAIHVPGGHFLCRMVPAPLVRQRAELQRFGHLAPHMRFVERSAGSLPHVALRNSRYGPKLERKQMVLFRLSILARSFCHDRLCVRAAMLKKGWAARKLQLADHFCTLSRKRIDGFFRAIFHNNDRRHRLAQEVLEEAQLARIRDPGLPPKVDTVRETPSPCTRTGSRD
jgi:hypothetical protein